MTPTPEQDLAEEYRRRARRFSEQAASVKSLGIYLLLRDMAREYEALAEGASGVVIERSR